MISLEQATALPRGEEIYENYESVIFNRTLCEYYYRGKTGLFFGCIAPDIDTARSKRDTWLQRNPNE